MNSTSNVTGSSPFAFNASNVIAASLVALQIILNLVGNVMVVVCFYHFPQLRTRCNYFIISLSLADLCVALFAMPFWLVLQLTEDMERDLFKVLNAEVYLFWSSVDILVGVASITNLAAVSFDRQLAITSPFRYHTILSHNNVIAVIVATWIYSILIASGRVLGSRAFLRETYIPVVITFGCFLPLLSMIFMYGRIYWVARSQAVKLGNYSRDIKAAKTIAIVIGTFLVCWLPFFLFTLSIYIFLCCSERVDHRPGLIAGTRTVKWMAYLNSCLNPIIYTCLNRPYRSAFYKMFKKCFTRDKFDRYSHQDRNHTTEKTVLTNQKAITTLEKRQSQEDSASYKKHEGQVVLVNTSEELRQDRI